ncbi:ecto-NOX disulfide-thiol exchanger 2 isoform X2 [Cylas formicarius]|uniref:ecto-NOX disulfide-thiol exchanger 2 isoform X2 n=1 Tax=Cylas formicarius TaxID=197179 RepID=UPI002958532F|nr:ecto-NOX disulfide-thiol exchanger 2 isoform X2 [Cylas formicarius]
MNDSPLEFSQKLPRDDRGDSSHSPHEKRSKNTKSRDRRDTEKSHDSDSNMSSCQEVLPVQNGNIAHPSMDGVMMNMFMNPSLMSLNNYMVPQILTPDPNLITQDPSMMLNPVKEIIHCKSCTLFPPNPNAPLPATRERPPGCRTVFVGGLPENMTEQIIGEIFERCGEITTLRLSKKNFCHIRFLYEASVDAAIFLSGYRVRIGSNADTANTGKLHVDYAQARDDQYEWECRQRQLQREQRHRERMEEERLRPPSPPPVIHYTDHEAANVSEKIKQDETFAKAVQVVITWLERGDCNKRNANNFYSMIQSTNSHVRRLLGEKSQYEEELRKAKDLLRGRMQGILLQFSQIERLFVAACHKKVWDHFTKAQRKNIEAWKRQSLEIKNIQMEERPEKERDDDEMDVSDDDEPVRKKQRIDACSEENNSLKEQNESLKCQVEAYQNEVEVLKMEYGRGVEDKERQLKMLQQTLQGMQQQLMETKKRQAEEEAKVRELQAKLKSDLKPDVITLDDDDGDHSDSISISEGSVVSRCDAKLIGIISAFLNVHPFGAGLDYIWSYVSKIESNLRPADIESLMNRFPAVFKQELVGIGANIERKWLFNAFNSGSRSSSSGV